MKMTEEEKLLTQLKTVELDLFRRFIDVCERMDLRYYVIGGTLLGAVRHRGFIPWDDDVDVGMPREDYDRFVTEGRKYLEEPYFIQTVQTDPQWPLSFAKLRNSRTTFVEKSLASLRINHGVGIDVFPLDPYPEKRSAQRWFDLRHELLKIRISCVFTAPEKKSRKLRLAQQCTKVLIPKLASAVRRRERLLRSVSESSLLANHSGAWGKREIMPADWYGRGTALTFEGLRVNAPEQYRKWLTQVYGDYMELPPEEKRRPHHHTEVIDLQRPYTEYGS